MAIEFKKTAFSGNTPVIWRGECKMLPGGFKPKQNFPVGTVLRRGVFIQVDFNDMTAGVIKITRVHSGGTTTAPRVAKGHLFAVGDTVMKYGVDNVSPSIKNIDTSNSSYDVITLDSEITGLTENDILIESTKYAATGGGSGEDPIPAAPLYVPNAVVGADLEFKGTGIPTIDAAYDAVVMFNHLSHPIPADWQQGMCLKSNPNILLIKQ